MLQRYWTTYMSRSGVITTVYYTTTEEQNCCIEGQRQELTAVSPLKFQFITKTTYSFELTSTYYPNTRQVSISAVQELRKEKNLLKGSSTYNNCTVLNIKYFRSVCFKNKLVCFQNSWKEFCWSFFLTPIKYVWVFIDKNSWDSIIHITHALLPNSHYTLTLAKGLSGEKKGILKCACLFFFSFFFQKRKKDTANIAKGEDLVEVRQRLKC